MKNQTPQSLQTQAWENHQYLIDLAQRAGQAYRTAHYESSILLLLELLSDQLERTSLSLLCSSLAQCGYQDALEIVSSYAMLLFPDFEAVNVKLTKLTPTDLKQVLTKMFTPPETKPKVSFCMIVKNEADKIIACLESVVSLVDEMIIIDTGSSDKTMELARGFSPLVQVYSVPWNNSFSEARNIFLEKASGDWIVYLDADETLHKESLVYLKQFFSYLPVGVNGFLVEEYSFGSTSELDFINQALRIFPNHPALQFYGAVHNQLYRKDSPFMLQSIVLPSVAISHTGYQKQEANLQKTTQRFQVLAASIDNESSPYFRYKYASDLLSYFREAEALQVLEKCWEDTLIHQASPPTLPWFPAPLDMVALLIFGLLYEQKNYVEMVNRYSFYQPYCPLAEFYYLYAEACFYTGHVFQAEAFSYHCLLPETPVFHPKGGYQSWKPLLLLLNLATHKKDLIGVTGLAYYLQELSLTKELTSQMQVVLANLPLSLDNYLEALNPLIFNHSGENALLLCAYFLLLKWDSAIFVRMMGLLQELKLNRLGKQFQHLLMDSGQIYLVQDICFEGDSKSISFEGLLWYVLSVLKTKDWTTSGGLESK